MSSVLTTKALTALTAALGLTVSSVHAVEESAGNSFAITAERVFDGEQVLPEATVIVRGGLIDALGEDIAVPDFLELIEQLQASPLHRLARTLTSWLEPIVAMWRFSRNNGITEGFHTKMEMMSRRAYGFRNFENYRLRVLTHCGWDGIINRV